MQPQSTVRHSHGKHNISFKPDLKEFFYLYGTSLPFSTEISPRKRALCFTCKYSVLSFLATSSLCTAELARVDLKGNFLPSGDIFISASDSF